MDVKLTKGWNLLDLLGTRAPAEGSQRRFPAPLSGAVCTIGAAKRGPRVKVGRQK